MSHFDPSIRFAFDKVSETILDAEQVFTTAKDGQVIRLKHNKDEIDLVCLECKQRLLVSSSKKSRSYFKHEGHSDDCILKEAGLSQSDIEDINQVLHAKESQRHKELKNKIGARLRNVEGVDVSSISIDDKVIQRGNDKRRPDVYCKYFDKELVFEIQLSKLSLRYILNRYNFYKKHNMFLIWILDNFDIRNQGQLEKDIKYIAKHQNFFKLDEGSDKFMLECQFKHLYLNSYLEVHAHWQKQSIGLNQVTFDKSDYQIFYSNYELNLRSIENLQYQKQVEQRRISKEKEEQEREADARAKAWEIKDRIDHLKSIHSVSYVDVNFKIADLDSYEIDIFNEEIGLFGRKTPEIIQWIDTVIPKDIAFIEFILNCDEIKLDIYGTDTIGRTAFMAIFQNKNIGLHRSTLLRGLMKRAYILTPEDRIFFETYSASNSSYKHDLILYDICSNLSDKNLVHDVFKHDKFLFIIETARKSQITGFNYRPDDWIGFANYVVHNHAPYWKYIEIAFKEYKLWDKLFQLDKKGTFAKKISELTLNMPKQNYDVDSIFRDLYPDLHYCMY